MKKCLLIGSGPMGLAHLKTLNKLDVDDIKIWAPTNRNKNKVEELGHELLNINLQKLILSFKPTHVILAIPVLYLIELTNILVDLGVKNILIEKPLSLSQKPINLLKKKIKPKKINIYIAYNRRFFSSIICALDMIKESKQKISSVIFEFNEVFDYLKGPCNQPKTVLNNWIIANSLHVIDTAFFPVGLPNFKKSTFFQFGNNVKWHPSGDIFLGNGVTTQNIPFSYNANWKAPGRWSFQWNTESNRYIFKPMEKLLIMQKGSFKETEVDIDNRYDRLFKPGIFLQNKSFLNGNKKKLLATLDHGHNLIKTAQIVGGYKFV
ncbi:hypothetical protein N8870_05390 [Alphaproteobacteria bacterium]|nr:hypothetical protein [Alphaproteobacteria bacterium]